jgi:signal transduction histidine kinase
MKDVEQQWQQQTQAAEIVRALLNEFGASTEYRVLRDSLPRSLATLLRCRCVLLYQRMGETLQLVAGSFADEPGWSASLLAVAHINPISLNGAGPEACAWRERHMVMEPCEQPTLVALPLMYRHRGIGVMVALRMNDDGRGNDAWAPDETRTMDVIADVVALLLENTRLLERDRERIHELSLLNSISNQMNGALYERERLQNIIVQRTKEISLADLCTVIEPGQSSMTASWVTPALRELLLRHFHEQQTPLMIERPGDGSAPLIAACLRYLPVDVKTFFAFPLLSSQETASRDTGVVQKVVPEVLGIIVGAYHHTWKLRGEEIVLLQVFFNQASAVLKNIQLMAEVVEAMTSVYRLEEEKRRLDRLAALGEMAANVAHEVRNPLASIKTAMQMLGDELVSSRVLQPVHTSSTVDQALYSDGHGGQSVVCDVQAGALESIDVVLKEVERLDTIVRELLQFARPRQLHRSCCNITELSDRVLHLLQRQCSEANVVVQRMYAPVPLVRVDIAQMEQVLLNLYMNALQAMPDGGSLTIACHLLARGQVLHEARKVKTSGFSASDTCVTGMHLSMRDGCQWLELTVSDTGPGIAPDQVERIFQPFFTTKAHGIGLGLAITRRLVEDHGGYIRVEGHFGYGATLSVCIPLLPDDEGEEGNE